MCVPNSVAFFKRELKGRCDGIESCYQSFAKLSIAAGGIPGEFQKGGTRKFDKAFAIFRAEQHIFQTVQVILIQPMIVSQYLEPIRIDSIVKHVSVIFL